MPPKPVVGRVVFQGCMYLSMELLYFAKVKQRNLIGITALPDTVFMKPVET